MRRDTENAGCGDRNVSIYLHKEKNAWLSQVLIRKNGVSFVEVLGKRWSLSKKSFIESSFLLQAFFRWLPIICSELNSKKRKISQKLIKFHFKKPNADKRGKIFTSWFIQKVFLFSKNLLFRSQLAPPHCPYWVASQPCQIGYAKGGGWDLSGSAKSPRREHTRLRELRNSYIWPLAKPRNLLLRFPASSC